MKFTVTKNELLKKLTPAMGSVATKDTVPSIEGVLLETLNNGTVQITTYNMNRGFRSFIPAVSVEREGKYIINAQRLYQTVRVLPDDDITFDINDKLNCTISSGRSVFNMSASRGADFPNIPDLVTEKGFTVDASKLHKMIAKVSHSIAVADNRPMLCGAYFKVSENGLEVVSCDSFRLSRCTMKCEISSFSVDEANGFSFIIPGTSLTELSKVLSDGADEKVKIYLSRKHAIFNKDDVIFFTRLTDTEYIDYQRIIPKDNDICVSVDRERLLSGLERANIIAEEKIQGSGRSYVKVAVDSHYLDLTSISVNGGVNDEMDCVHEGGPIEIGFNCRYLIDAVKVAEGESILMKFKTASSPVTIEPLEKADDFDYFYMVLPVRMNDAR